MNQWNWNYPTNVRVGQNRINELAQLCHSLGITRPLLVTDPTIATLPFYAALKQQLGNARLQYGEYTETRANPTGKNIEDGLAKLKAAEHDGVVTIGGGSALDVGKTLSVMAHQSCSVWDLEDIGDNFQNANTNDMVPCIAVPTTAGTGSEVGRAALIVHEQQRRKVIIFHPAMLPDAVILDPALTIGLPANLTAATGMDALSHNLEAYCSPVYHPMAEGIAMSGIQLVKQYLPTAVAHGENIEARLNMLVASTMGATAFQKGLGAMHALAHPLGAIYNAHHGMLNAVLMPYVLVRNRESIEKKIEHLSVSMGIKGGFDGFLDWVLTLRRETGIPHSLAEILSADEVFRDIGRMAVIDPSAGTNPIALDANDYQLLAEAALNGKL